MNKPVILCVDDEKIVLNSLKTELKSAMGDRFIVEIAESGQNALELFADFIKDNTEVALIISDYMMPNMKGDELLAKLHQLVPESIKILLTGEASLAGVTNAVNYANLYRYIAKPWERRDLILTVEEGLKSYYKEKLLVEQNLELLTMNRMLEKKVEERTKQIQINSIEIMQQKEELSIKNTIISRQLKDLEEALNEVQKSETRLTELNSSKDKFFSILAHDLRSPLNALGGFLSLLTDFEIEMSTDEIRSIASDLEKNVKASAKYLENLLVWARSQMNAVEFKPENCKIIEIATLTIELLEAKAKSKNIKIICNIPANLVVVADKNHLQVVFTNLIANALKFTNNGGKITMYSEALTTGDFVKISVIDTGVGIPKELLADIFRIDKKHTTVGTDGEFGTGLGLLLCKEFVEKNNGEISVESEENKGTSFHITLPSKLL
jgi:two-component system sensor histidine kinase/response regulator